MNRAKDHSVVKILTDIQIKQSPIWYEKTHYLGNLNPQNGLIDRLPNKTKGILLPIYELIKILKYCNRYDVVINANIRTAQLFALMRRIFHIKTPKHIILELMLDEENKSLTWKIKRMIQKIIFSSVDIIFVSSSKEIETYSARFGISNDKFRFLLFHTNIVEPRVINRSGNYILSAGKTGRDYETLANAVRSLNQKVIVVSDKKSTQGINFPIGVEVLHDISYANYLELLHNCSLVVVPLKKLVKSTGQVVILDAMALGKPVISTETTGTVDYIRNGINGILVPTGNVKALKDAINTITADNDLYKNISINALESIKQHHTFDGYTDRILQAAKEIMKMD